MEYTCKTLENADLHQLYQTFLAAFSDYAVKMDLSFEEYRKMLQRRGMENSVSVGAFSDADSQQMIGMMINGLREWQGRRTAYDLMTGVVPSDRRLGVTKNMFAEVLVALEKEEVEQYLLEVLQENRAAVALYKKQGFEITRSFSVFKLDKNGQVRKPSVHSNNVVDEPASLDWGVLSGFWDFVPSWQNSIASILAVSDAFICVTISNEEEIVGYGLIDQETGDIPQIAVQDQYRRKGIGSSIVSSLAKHTKASAISIINIDDRCEGMKDFLKQLGFKQTTKQYEMIRSFHKNI
ncbi:GNAT family N-acetyltransferase [Enterococcus larvae]|uniref:GNAT family N-acetyltransferase n=1 Tax=Enterococcus larvae TaxID=2794352 RepID=UPI003F2D4D5D